MKPAKIAVIVVAAIAAIGLALVVRSMGTPSQQDRTEAVVEAAPTAKILVAAVDLQPGRRLVASDMVWKDWPLADVNPAFITDGSVPIPTAAASTEAAATKADEKEGNAATRAIEAVASINGPTAADGFVGSVVRESILAGEPIVLRKIVRPGESGYLAAFLDPGMKAMSIPVSVDTAAGGFILPGDRVDVVLTREVEVPNPANPENTIKRNVSTTVMQNLKILAIDQSAQPPTEEMTVVGATATLEVNARDAETLALARAEGNLTLLLRSYADAAGPRGLIPGAVRRGEMAPRRASSTAGSAPDDGRTVRVFRGEATPELVVLP